MRFSLPLHRPWEGVWSRRLGIVFNNVEQLIIVQSLSLVFVFYHLVETLIRYC